MSLIKGYCSVSRREASRRREEKYKWRASVKRLGLLLFLTIEERIGHKLWTKVVKSEQQAKYLRSLIKFKVGTNRIETNQVKSRMELRRDSGRRVKEIMEEDDK